MEVTLNGITSAPNFIKFYQAVQKLLVGGGGDTDRHTDTETVRETGGLISLLSFLEYRLKTEH
jgi:hypothetical protein